MTSNDAMDPGLRAGDRVRPGPGRQGQGLESDANPDDAEELRAMLADLQAAVDRGSENDIRAALREVEELVFLPRRRVSLQPSPGRGFR